MADNDSYERLYQKVRHDQMKQTTINICFGYAIVVCAIHIVNLYTMANKA